MIRWQPIDDSTPRGGKKILLAKIVGHPDHATSLWWACLGFWSERWGNWNDGIEPAGLAGPTHWLPASGHGVGDGPDAGSRLRVESKQPEDK